MFSIDVKKTIYTFCPNFLHPLMNRVETSEIGYRLARGTFWSVFGAVISKGLGLASSIIVARALGRDGFGEIGIIYSTVAMFELFASFGLGVTATKYVAQYRQSNPLTAGRIISLAWIVNAITGVACAILLAVFSPWLAEHVLAAPHLSSLLRITAISLFFTALNSSQNGTLAGFEAFKTLSVCNLIAGLLNFPIMVVGVLLAGLHGAVWAIVVSCSLNWFICHLAVRHEARRFKVPLAVTGCLQEMHLIWKFSLPAVLSGMMVTPVHWVCNTMLVNQPNGYTEMGILNAANQWRSLIIMLPNLLLGPVLPILSSAMVEQENSNSFKKTLDITQSFMVLVSFPICTGLMFFADSLLRLYWNTTTAKDSVVFIILLSVALIQCLGAVTGSAIAAKGKMWLGLALNLSWAVIYIVIVAVFVGKEGITALAFGQGIAYICLTLWGFIYIWHDLPKGLLYRVFIGLCLTCLITSICLLVPVPYRVWLSIPLVVGVSALAIRYLVNSEVRKALRALYMSEKAEII
jgi:O-antigen/teichoic acid export membrane protein